MKKLGLLIAGGIAAMVLVSNLGPIVGFAVSAAILYFVFKQFIKAESTMAKIGYGIIGFIALMATASNFPAILGLAAAYVLYLVYKKWNDSSSSVMEEDNDPFANFEKQWADLNRN
ncbi:flagellar basal body rod protein [Cytobacillus oceanisediminis]|uniref:lmo0954 family membrane protein n=1 Tax=Cytobacillus oceanisediminis TaxID=665099 RepID=UPI0023DB063B|nr:flagellar basal body rod protein [Cytobacillus oceanisediminis]MDF2038145.1 flagellar basal body rod protein [Cytobacillus oceanisediminis]